MGSLVVGWDGWRCHLYRLAVEPSARRTGVAGELARAAVMRATRLGAVRLDAMVDPDNGAAVAFWESAGFELDADRRWSLLLPDAGAHGRPHPPVGGILHVSLPVRDLGEARTFYEEVLECRVGRVRHDWLDVWFFGMQLTLQERPGEVLPRHAQGVRHVGVALDRPTFEAFLDRLQQRRVEWLAEVSTAASDALSGKTGVKLADPSGNVVELKCYDDLERYRASTSTA